ncbi:methyltransferase [Clostridia bacterium]|nr:methyltransferase [Clostridia bacterium]
MTFCVPCLFGLEGLVADELRRMDVPVAAQNGRVLFEGTFADMAAANLRLRTGERVLLQVGTFAAESFDALFEGVKALPWEDYLGADAEFPVKGHALESKLVSIPDCQKIIKKAVVERLKTRYKTEWFKENGARYRIQFSIHKNTAALYLDTSGAGLHKRGYRPRAGIAPLRETLAAAMVTLSKYRGRGILADPYCGSGTICIEAALIAKNRAPGLTRAFDAEHWGCVPAGTWDAARALARAKEVAGEYQIWGGDRDPACVELAKANAARAGVSDCVSFGIADARLFKPLENTIIVTNPPYGERLDDAKSAETGYRAFGKSVPIETPLYILSPHPEFELHFGRKAMKKRKLYNGMIQCNLFMWKL